MSGFWLPDTLTCFESEGMEINHEQAYALFQREKRYLYIVGLLIIFTRVLGVETREIDVFGVLKADIKNPESVNIILGAFFIWFMYRFNMLSQKLSGSYKLEEKFFQKYQDSASPKRKYYRIKRSELLDDLNNLDHRLNFTINDLDGIGYDKHSESIEDRMFEKFGFSLKMSRNYTEFLEVDRAESVDAIRDSNRAIQSLEEHMQSVLDKYTMVEYPSWVRWNTRRYAAYRMLVSDIAVGEVIAPIIFIGVVTAIITYYTAMNLIMG